MQFNVMPWTSIGVDAFKHHAQKEQYSLNMESKSAAVVFCIVETTVRFMKTVPVLKLRHIELPIKAASPLNS